jgi:hypothetical protein
LRFGGDDGEFSGERNSTVNMRTDEFLTAAMRNPVHTALLDELDRRALPDAWIVAGSLTQTVWNGQTGRAIGYGINDYDVFYFDPDLSWDAEDRVIAAFGEVSDRLGARIEMRNQARVHLWYPQKHGTLYPALTRATDGIDRFLTRCTQVGIRRNADGRIDVHAPAGLDDIAAMTVRPNPAASFSAEAYRIKAARWRELWPELTVISPDS